mgnify:CR=1 FL=1
MSESELLDNFVKQYHALKSEIGKVIVGQDKAVDSLLLSIFTGGHCLLVGVPGLAKTLMVNTLSHTLGLTFSRIQFTPDLMPSDITGSEILDENRHFQFIKGPVFANIVLADEINRTPPKTQAALLEAMQEKAISIGGKTYKLPDVFIVIATQNPIEQEGTYVLSEAQLDRFLLKEKITYPDATQEIEILNRIEQDVFSAVQSVATLEDIKFLQNLCQKVYVDPSVKKYIVDIVQATRITDKILPPALSQYVAMGSSTRAAIAFMEVAKAVALVNGRDYCTPDDVKSMRYSVLRHRIMMNFAAVADGVAEETIIDAIIGAVKTP